ncbi:hypothetical protein [Sporomusa termitida]|uniref:Glycosyl transferase family 2 n=1 Tax=Sporomusa termitida TaxID=2377 RepID=A0A517DX73_9FIRM|nr:hypothetical protein [Sporomusa termitida]QDR81948.1 hypothetical protein SPTER_33680 [Sporomusa termitida]
MDMDTQYEKIKDKRIAIFGTGNLQSDIMGLFTFNNLLYFVDDFYNEQSQESFIPADKQVYDSAHLLNEDRNDLFILICDKDEDYAARRLETMGFKEDIHYGFGEDLLINYPLFESIKSNRIHIWGAGNTYSYHKAEIFEYLDTIQSFIISQSDNSPASIEGKPVIPFSEAQIAPGDFIIVCSIYYNEIAHLLENSGLKIGRDFINIRTFSLLGKLSTFSTDNHSFVDRAKGSEELLVILSGYKNLVWESVFPRLKQYVPTQLDVVVVTSGLVNQELQLTCERYGWSYVSTERNNVSLAVNVAISLHPKAKYIYKIDEDIFVTQGCFEMMRTTYDRVQAESKYEVGFVTPLIPVNGYGYVRLLEIFDAVKQWEDRFGELVYTDCYHHHGTIHDSPAAALFMWGENNPKFVDIDEMARKLREADFQYSICPIRYSIGFILFTKRNWVRMGMFPIKKHLNLGADEERICEFCLMHARVMVVAENAIVGHLSYGPQHKVMAEYYCSHTKRFLPK